MNTWLDRLADHNAWANGRLAKAIDEMEDAPEAERLFAHIVRTEEIYLERLKGHDPWPQDFWPGLDRGDTRRQAAANVTGYQEFLDALDSAGLKEKVRYRNSAGVPFETSIADLLAHLFLHGSHHRGQIGRLLREQGHEPPAVDFIVFTREHSD